LGPSIDDAASTRVEGIASCRFYLKESATQRFLELVMPIIFVYFANTANVLLNHQDNSDFVDFLAVSVGLSLTVVFVLPVLSQTSSSHHNSRWRWNNLFVIWVFLAMLATSVAYYYSRRLKLLSIVFQWVSLLVPIHNSLSLLAVRTSSLLIFDPRRGAPVQVPGPRTCNAEGLVARRTPAHDVFG